MSDLIQTMVYANFASALVADFSVAGALCWYLYKSRSYALSKCVGLGLEDSKPEVTIFPTQD